ncbi:MAG: ArsR/SmtB family transcription factor [Chloroflexota bacterium]
MNDAAGLGGPGQEAIVSIPLDVVCVLSLLHRAVPESHFAPWLVETRQRLSPGLRENLDLLHGFSGERLYYVEEPALAFRPLDPDRAGASFETFVAFLLTQPAAAYLEMAERAIARALADLGLPAPALDPLDRAWRAAVSQVLTTATLDETAALLSDPAALKRRTIDLFTGVWEEGYGEEFDATRGLLEEACRLARQQVRRPFREAFMILTGQKPPSALTRRLPDIGKVAFCPSDYLGSDISYILAPPLLVVDFGAPEFILRATASEAAPPPPSAPGFSEGGLLEIARALADPTRLRILGYLTGGERYAQEIVSHAGIAQSAISRHLSQLERAGLIQVSPRRGQKFYSVNAEALDFLALTFRTRAEEVRGNRRGEGATTRS